MVYKVYDINNNSYASANTIDEVLTAREDIINRYLIKMSPYFGVIEENEIEVDGVIHSTQTAVDMSVYPIVYKNMYK